MNEKGKAKFIARVILLFIGVAVSVYGLYCAWQMNAYIGTGHYWSNPWFYKGHACLFALIAIDIVTDKAPEKPKSREQ